MTVVALTGGIASGKSLVTQVLESRGIHVVDADHLAREAVAPGSVGLRQVISHFGPEVLDESGTLDRGRLGQRVFSDPEARQALNAILHPEISRLSASRLAHLAKEYPNTPLVYAIPLLQETKRHSDFDVVVVVDAPAPTRIQRLVSFRGMSEDDAINRVQAQATDEERRSLADILIDASGDEATTKQGAEELASWLWQVWPDRLDEIPHVLPSPEGYTLESATDT